MFNKDAGKACLLELAGHLDKWQIPFFLIQGTALGAWRDRGFVPDEKDIDLGILQEHLAGKAIHLVSELLKSGFEIETFSRPFSYIKTIVAYKYGVKADLVGLARWKEYRFTSIPERPWITEPYCIVHNARLLENLSPINLFGRKFYIPSDIILYLTTEYGSDWGTPKDDHVSRTRVYDFLVKECIPNDLLNVEYASP